MSIKEIVKRVLPDRVVDTISVVRRSRPTAARTCNLCGHHGTFLTFGRPIRPDARCPKCDSLERHRQFWLWFQRRAEPLPGPLLHFAPEPQLTRHLSAAHPASYTTADLYMSGVDLQLDLESIDLPDASVGTVIAHQVLEHVDDSAALRELHRILSPGGLFIWSTPIIESWAHTYENPDVLDARGRELHFGQDDHVRFYGRDVRDRVLDAGFVLVDEHRGSPKECVEYSLQRGETIFIHQKA